MTARNRDFNAILCFGVPEEQVDELIEAAEATSTQPSTWFVVGSNMNRLSGLAAHWGRVTEVVVVLSTSFDEQTVDAALLVLENENMDSSNCLWLQGYDVASPLPSGIRTRRLARSFDAADFAAILQPNQIPRR